MPIRDLKIDNSAGKETPLYQQIRDHLKGAIEDRTFKVGERLPTAASLIKQWNVDYGTVRSAFNLLAEDGLVRLENRKGAVVTDFYRTRTYTLMYVRWGSDAYAMDLSEGARRYCDEHEQEFVCLDAKHSQECFLDAVAHAPQEIDGLFACPLECPEHLNAFSMAITQGARIVFADRTLPGLNVSSVTNDDFAGAYRSTEHLIATHGIPVCYIGLVNDPSSCRERFKGWRAAMQDHGFSAADDFLAELPYSEDDPITYTNVLPPLKDLALEVLRQCKNDRHCFFASNDSMGQALYLAARESGLVVGVNVFVIGFGDMPLCPNLDPPMTSVRQPRLQMGYEAAKLLHQTLTKEILRPVHLVLPVELMIRTSSTGVPMSGRPSPLPVS